MKKGSKMSPEAIQKIREAKKNISEETRKKIGEAHKGKVPWNKDLNSTDPRVANNTRGGWHHTTESKQLMSEKKKGIIPVNKGLTKYNSESIRRGAEKLANVPKSETHCKNISLGKLGSIPHNKGLTMTTSEVVRKNVEASTKTIREQFKNGRSTWNKNLTKEIDDRIADTGGPSGQILGPRPDDVKEKIRAGNLGQKRDDSCRAKLSLSKYKYYETHNNFWKGKKLPYSTWNIGVTKFDHPSMMSVSNHRVQYLSDNKHMLKHNNRGVSNQEIALDEFLRSNGFADGVDYVWQGVLEDSGEKFSVDFIFPKVHKIFESGADFWHNDKSERDAVKAAVAEHLGYEYISVDWRELVNDESRIVWYSRFIKWCNGVVEE